MIQLLGTDFDVCLITLRIDAFRASVSYFLQSDLTYFAEKLAIIKEQSVCQMILQF